MKKIYIIICLVFLSGSFYVQSTCYASDSEEEFSLSKIKIEISELLSQNVELTEQQNQLDEEASSLEYKVEKLKKEIEKMVSFSWEVVSHRKEKEMKKKSLEAKYKQLEKNASVMKARNAFLEGVALDAIDTKNLWKLKLAEQDYRIRELQLKVQHKQKLYDEKEAMSSSKIEALKKELQEEKTALRSLEKKVSEVDQKLKDVPGEVEALRKKVLIAEKEMEGLTLEENIVLKKNKILKDKKKIIVLDYANKFKKSKEKKKSLAEEVLSLKKDYDALNVTMKDSLVIQNRNKEMVEMIEALDIENRDLRQKIDKIKSQLEYFK